MRRSLLPSPRAFTRVALASALTLGLAACGGSDGADDTGLVPSAPDVTAVDGATDSADLFPDILEAVATEANGSWSFAVTVSSPYDSVERYADGFRILDAAGNELGFRLLTHDHASEQPFTRTLHDVVIPDGVSSVVIEGRDQISGFGGATIDLALPDR